MVYCEHEAKSEPTIILFKNSLLLNQIVAQTVPVIQGKRIFLFYSKLTFFSCGYPWGLVTIIHTAILKRNHWKAIVSTASTSQPVREHTFSEPDRVLASRIHKMAVVFTFFFLFRSWFYDCHLSFFKIKIKNFLFWTIS